MRRIRSVFAVAATAAALLAMTAAPAIAQDRNGNGGISFNSSGGDFDGSFRSSGSSWSWDDDGFFSDLDIEQEAVSGDIDLDTDISLSGDNSNQSAPVVQFANTGNNQNALVFDQFGSEVEDFEFEGGFISFDPEFEFDSDQEVEQSSAA